MELFNDTARPPITTSRNPWVAMLMSLFIPGLGQVYNGQLPKGVLGVSLLLLAPLAFGLARWTAYFTGFAILVSLELAIKLWLIVDAFVQARRLKVYVRKSYNSWLNHLLIGLGIFVVVSVIDIKELMGVETFTIPFAAMEPTIEVGDYVAVDLWAYKKDQPAYGHIIAAKGTDGNVYAFRVVGLPGDEVEVVDNHPIVNGKAWPHLEDEASSSRLNGLELRGFTAKTPLGIEHRGYAYDMLPPKHNLMPNYGPVTVASGHFFLMADSRDNGVDSRFLGEFDVEGINGRLVYTYWGATWDRVGVNLRHQ